MRGETGRRNLKEGSQKESHQEARGENQDLELNGMEQQLREEEPTHALASKDESGQLHQLGISGNWWRRLET